MLLSIFIIFTFLKIGFENHKPYFTFRSKKRIAERSHSPKIKFISKAFPRRFQESSEEIIVPQKTVTCITGTESNCSMVELKWDYFVQNQILKRTFHGFSGVGKHFSINGKRIFSSEIHPMSGIQSLYDSMGKKLLR